MGWIKDEAVPLLEGKILDDGVGAKLRLEEDKFYLEYEAVRSGTGYVRPTVLLEFGARSTGEPARHHKIKCDLAEALEGLILPEAEPRVMDAERTFWEKATAIHAYCLRGAFRGGDRNARHWYDLDCLDSIGVADRALQNGVLSDRFCRIGEARMSTTPLPISSMS